MGTSILPIGGRFRGGVQSRTHISGVTCLDAFFFPPFLSETAFPDFRVRTFTLEDGDVALSFLPKGRSVSGRGV